MIRKVQIFFLFFLSVSFLLADLTFFPESPSKYALRDYSIIELPFTDFEGMATNDIFTYNDFTKIWDMLKSDYTLTDEDKDLIIQGDLNISTYNRISAFEFGMRNWNFSSDIFAFGNLLNLDENFLDVALRGIGVEDTTDAGEQKIILDDFTSNLGEGSKGMVFLKNKFTYSKFNPIFLYDIFDFVDIDLTFFPGVNINIYNPVVFGEITSSAHTVNQDDDGGGVLDYEYDIKYISSASKYTILGHGFGFGFGFKVQFDKGWFYFSLDDILNRMTFKSVEQTTITKVFESQEELELTTDTTITETLGDYTYRLDASFATGLEYYFNPKLSLMLKYTNSEYLIDDGFTGGLNYMLFKNIPLQIFGGEGKQPFYTIRTGFIAAKFETTFSLTFYDGLFGNAKGIGIGMDLFTIKF